MKHYVRFSNCVSDYFVADVGSDLDGDAGTVTDYESIRLDRLLYPYTCYHFDLRSLGPDLIKYVRYLQGVSTGFGGPKPAFRGNPVIRTQPTVTNLLAADATTADLEYSTFLPAVTELCWDFTNTF